MPDAHWVRYRQIRGGAAPDNFELAGTAYRLHRVLKRDFYAVTGVYRRENAEDATGGVAPSEVLLKIYHTERVGLGLFPLERLGRWLCRRECHYLQRLESVAGVPKLLERYGLSGLVREYVPGCNLREFAARQPPDLDFFPRLGKILDEVHARGVAHNDLSKPENVLVTPDGAPVLIDLQIALEAPLARWPLVGHLTRWIVAYLQGVDRYHLTKQHRRRRPQDFSDEQIAAAKRRGALLHMHAWIRRPYRGIRHTIMRRLLINKDT